MVLIREDAVDVIGSEEAEEKEGGVRSRKERGTASLPGTSLSALPSASQVQLGGHGWIFPWKVTVESLVKPQSHF